VTSFVDRIADIQLVWSEIPKSQKESKDGLQIQNQLLKEFHKNFYVIVDGVKDQQATNAFWNKTRKYCDFADLLLAVLTTALSVGDSYETHLMFSGKKENLSSSDSDSNRDHTKKKAKHTHTNEYANKSKSGQNAPKAAGKPTFKLEEDGTCYGCGNRHDDMVRWQFEICLLDILCWPDFDVVSLRKTQGSLYPHSCCSGR
jgi:hypothetical protein